MKTELTTEQKVKINLIKATINDLQEQQDKLFNQLLEDLNVVEPADNDAIFDYIYNDYINPTYDLWQQETSQKIQ
jgi:hypothetical protein